MKTTMQNELTKDAPILSNEPPKEIIHQQENGLELYNSLRNQFGLKKDWLRIALENAPIKIKQNEIAKKMGVHESLISYVLDGKRVYFGIRLEKFIKKLYEVEKV